MPTPFTLSLTATPDPADVQAVQDGLLAYNLQHAPDGNHLRLGIFAKTDDGRLIGGLLGDSNWEWMCISYLWLDESVRGQGLGTHLLKAAEAEATRRNCHHMFVDTMSFQALPFYQKYGYEIWGKLEDFPTGHQRYFLKKKLASG
jgi:GNAT superfamily N-acetyltransferase